MPDLHDRIVQNDKRDGRSVLMRVLYWLIGCVIALGISALVLYSFGLNALFEKQSGTGVRKVTTAQEALSQCTSNRAGIKQECILLQEYFCNQPALEVVFNALARRNDYRSISLLGTEFLEKCDDDENIGFFTAEAYFRLSNFEQTVKILDRFPSTLSISSQFASWRGFALEKLMRYQEAADEFQRALFLFPDLSKVGAQQFYYVTRTLKQVKRYCDGIAPLQLYLSFDRINRTTTQIEQEIRSLRELGDCEADTAPNKAIIPLSQEMGVFVVEAEVNGVQGRFILDTGSSTVHLSLEFARRAKVELSENRKVVGYDVGGERVYYFDTLANVTVNRYRANDVLAFIASEAGLYENGIDGLLGQTYLGRFKYEINSDRLMLMPLQ